MEQGKELAVGSVRECHRIVDYTRNGPKRAHDRTILAFIDVAGLMGLKKHTSVKPSSDNSLFVFLRREGNLVPGTARAASTPLRLRGKLLYFGHGTDAEPPHSTSLVVRSWSGIQHGRWKKRSDEFSKVRRIGDRWYVLSRHGR